MQIDDRYRAKLQAVITAIRYWTPSVSDVAKITEDNAEEYWRVRFEPRTPGACPFELVIRTDGFHDLVIAGETYEDQPTEDLDFFVPFCAAIARGQLIRRIHKSAATGLPLAIETIVTTDDGRQWRRRRDIAPDLPSVLDYATLIEDARFLPYHRN